METTTNQPLISIGIPTFNGGRRIPDTLASIWNQQYPSLDVIISDNCSTDNTLEVCAEACEQRPEIRYFRQKKNVGILSNFEFVLSQAKGKYFMWIADDDFLEPGALQLYVNFLERNPSYALVSGQIRYWDGGKAVFTERDFTLKQNWPGFRVVSYYFRVIYGGMFHGMMRSDLGTTVPTRKVFGNDFHFVASLAYLGKLRSLDAVGYNKRLGGLSKDVKKCAKVLGESNLAANFPYIKMAIDAYAEVMFRSPIYAGIPFYFRFPLALFSAAAVTACYYGRIFPLAVAGKIKRFILRPFASKPVEVQKT